MRISLNHPKPVAVAARSPGTRIPPSPPHAPGPPARRPPPAVLPVRRRPPAQHRPPTPPGCGHPRSPPTPRHHHCLPRNRTSASDRCHPPPPVSLGVIALSVNRGGARLVYWTRAASAIVGGWAYRVGAGVSSPMDEEEAPGGVGVNVSQLWACRLLLLRIAGIARDDLVHHWRRWLVEGRALDVRRAVTYAVLSQRIRLIDPDIDLLGRTARR
jgi:hypothetical protein